MKMKGPIPVLYVTDIKQSLRFYCNVLGFRCANRLDGWASLRLDQAEIMLSLPNEHLAFEKPIFTGSFYSIQKTWTLSGNSFATKRRLSIPSKTLTMGCGNLPFAMGMATSYSSAKRSPRSRLART